MLLFLSLHLEALEDPWEKCCVFSTRICICVPLFVGKLYASVEPQVSCQSAVLCSVPASLLPFLKDRRTDGLAVTLVTGQNFAVEEECKELPLQWKGGQGE